MRKNFKRMPAILEGERLTRKFWLGSALALLVILNGIALFLYLDPPGGTRAELEQESLTVRNEIQAAHLKTDRLRNVSAKVTVGNAQATDFTLQYFLPKRAAYASVLAEVQRMAAAAGLQEKDAVYTEEPIEGTADLNVLNCTANFEGTFDNLMRFVYEVDRSPMLLMLDNLQAAPQQHGGRINTSIRFQVIMQDNAPGGQL